MPRWPDLRLMGAAITQSVSPDGVANGLLVSIRRGDTRKYGMNLIKSGFVCEPSSGLQVGYRRIGKTGFILGDLQGWFPDFDRTRMMGEVDAVPAARSINDVAMRELLPQSNEPLPDYEAMASKNHYGYQPEEAAPEERRRAPNKSHAGLPTPAVLAGRRPFCITHDGIVAIYGDQYSFENRVKYPERQAEIEAAVREWERKRYGEPKDQLISRATIDGMVKQILAKETELVEACRWVGYRFGKFGAESIEALIVGLTKNKKQSGTTDYKLKRERIERLIADLRAKHNPMLVATSAVNASEPVQVAIEATGAAEAMEVMEVMEVTLDADEATVIMETIKATELAPIQAVPSLMTQVCYEHHQMTHDEIEDIFAECPGFGSARP